LFTEKMRPLISVLIPALLLAASAAAFAAPGDDLYSRPGIVVAASDGARLNLYCMGNGSPTVVFDSGWEDWAPAWAVVQPRIARWTRACSYDRAGAGFSGPGPMPRTSVRIADELQSALHNAGIAGPYILVGNAFGGDPVRTFAQRYPADVAGLVLVEADASDVEISAMQDADHRANARNVARLRECRDAVAVGKPLPLLPPRPGQPPRTCAQQFFRGLPEAEWSANLNASVLQIAQTKVAMYDAYISEMEEMAGDEAWLQQHVSSLGSRPVRVLTTGNHGVGHLPARDAQDPKHIEYERQIALAQARWLSLSSNAKQIFVRDSSEYIEFDAPQAVVDAIQDVYAQSRAASPAPPIYPGAAPAALPSGVALKQPPKQVKAYYTSDGFAAVKAWYRAHLNNATEVQQPGMQQSEDAFLVGQGATAQAILLRRVKGKTWIVIGPPM
jgi:pimeloyl-ACP methyl ester carboxylesterase